MKEIRINCNQCDDEISSSKVAGDDSKLRRQPFDVEYSWERDSPWSGEVHSFTLCQKCYVVLIESFVHPLDVTIK